MDVQRPMQWRMTGGKLQVGVGVGVVKVKVNMEDDWRMTGGCVGDD